MNKKLKIKKESFLFNFEMSLKSKRITSSPWKKKIKGSSSRILLLLFSRWVMSNSLQPHGLQHTRLPCPSPSPGVCSNSCPLSQWCHPAISSFVPPSPPAFCKKKQNKNSITHTTVRWWDLSGPLCVGTKCWLIHAGRSLFPWLCTSCSYDGAGEIHPLPTWSFFSSVPENPSCLLQAPHPLAPWVLATIITQDMDSQFQSPRFGSADTGGQ